MNRRRAQAISSGELSMAAARRALPGTKASGKEG
jgi:hypothetical protein